MPVVTTITQLPVEVAEQSDPGVTTVTHAPVEVAEQDAAPLVVVTQVAVETCCAFTGVCAPVVTVGALGPLAGVEWPRSTLIP